MHAPAVQPVNQHIQSHCDTNSKIISILTVFSRWTIVFFHCLFWKSLWYRFMQARCPAYQQTNSVTALTKENTMHVCETQSNQIHWIAVCIPCYHLLCWLTQITNGPLIKKTFLFLEDPSFSISVTVNAKSVRFWMTLPVNSMHRLTSCVAPTLPWLLLVL